VIGSLQIADKILLPRNSSDNSLSDVQSKYQLFEEFIRLNFKGLHTDSAIVVLEFVLISKRLWI